MIKWIATQAIYVSDQTVAEEFWRNKVGSRAPRGSISFSSLSKVVDEGLERAPAVHYV
jgi:hypothetical protein